MSRRGKKGIPVARGESDYLIINPDGSINAQTMPNSLTGVEPVVIQVGVAATLLSAANSSRRTLNIFNNDVNTIYIGFSTAVTVATGKPLLPYCSSTILGITGAVYAISTVADTDVRVMELTG